MFFLSGRLRQVLKYIDIILLNRKQTIHSEKTFDFLRDLVSNVPDHQPDEEGDSNASVPSGSSGPEVKKQKIQKYVRFMSWSDYEVRKRAKIRNR